ncbi:MAG: DUF5615 family PIN-like protein [Anaerolineae bacterium]|nr:DUF5615 family PIN-like protein [Anaerolineae bacterium]
MKLLLDQGLPRSAASLLREAGIDTVHTGEIDLSTATDAEIMEKAGSEGRIIVTLDSDFHTLLALSGASQPSVIRIRIERQKGAAIAALLQKILSEWGTELEAGVVLSVQPNRVRFRYLPLISGIE